MTSFARLKPMYVSLSTRNNGLKGPTRTYLPDETPDDTIIAKLSTDFKVPVVEKASDFIIAVERLELSLNGIPFYDATDDTVDHNIVVRSKVQQSLTQETTLDANAYSLNQLIEELNALEFTDPNEPHGDFQVTFSLDADGFIQMFLPSPYTFETLQFEFPRVLNNILGISTTVQFTDQDWCKSLFPRFDMGDDLDHLILETNLPTNTDALGNVKLPVLTDFAPPSVYSTSLTKDDHNTFSLTGAVLNARQKVIYTPTEKRYLNLNGDFPIHNITIGVHYVNIDGKVKHVQLPVGGIFEVKLGFYLRQ